MLEQLLNMIITVNDNITVWQEVNPLEIQESTDQLSFFDSKDNLSCLGFNKERISIRKRWFDVLTPSELVRTRNKSDGYYRVIYIQINMATGEYYIGKANRPNWSELKRYQGSGLKFAHKFKKNKMDFVRYYIAACNTAEETEKLEASIVDKGLLADELCLNLVSGGGGTTKHTTKAETRQKKRDHMLNNPEQYKPMLDASKKAFQSGDTQALRARSHRIKEVMSDDKYRSMSRTRMEQWKEKNPSEYAEARRKNSDAIRTPEVQEKRNASLKEWIYENPDEYKAWQEKRIESLSSQESKDKRKESLKEWREKNPEQAKANDQKRAKAAAEKTSKEIFMIDLQSGEVLRTFPSQHEAARWLVKNGKAKNTNCVSSIGAVCLRKPCTTGHGYRKKAYGYDWRFASDIEAESISSHKPDE